jgi:competence protein ComEC
MSVLAPCSEQSPPFGANDASLVIKMSYGTRSALFTGDVEVRGEASLLEHHAELLNSDLLKVPHHGSDTSSSRSLLDAVSPSFAIISSGVRNRFDHPRPSTLSALSQTLDDRGRRTQILRTDDLGSISWSTDGHSQSIRTFTPPSHPVARLYL